MSQECPRCRLLSPEEAVRCDCGFDFTLKSVQPSYVVADYMDKHGGAAESLRRLYRRHLRSAALLLGLAAILAVTGARGWAEFAFGCGVIQLSRAFYQYRVRLRLRDPRMPWKEVEQALQTDVLETLPRDRPQGRL